MRRIVLLGSVLLPAALTVAGCASAVPRADGPAGPVTPSPTVSSAPGTAPSPAGSGPSTSSSSAPPNPSHTATPHRPTVLGPTGLGALKLGMTSKKATATGLIVAWNGTPGAGCGLRSHLEAAHGVGDGNDGTVLYSGDTGVEVIDAYPGISTPEGIHLGSTKAQMLKAYPDWVNAETANPHADGRGGAGVPGNADATYRIVTENGKVVELTLQYTNQNCYE